MRPFIMGGLLGFTAVAWAEEPAETLKVEPVELVRGSETEGKEHLSATHYRFRYLFASEKNRAEFERQPDRFEIHVGGACGRMGALSRLGRTDIYTAYKGKIYIFASQSCKEAFLRDPEKVLDRPDEIPDGSAGRR